MWQKIHELQFDDNLGSPWRWSNYFFEEFGLRCVVDDRNAVGSCVKRWQLGPVVTGHVKFLAQSVAPVDDKYHSWPGEQVMLKLVESGFIDVERNRGVQRFEAGSVVVLDLAQDFTELFSAATELTVVIFPKSLLEDRGTRLLIDGPTSANSESSDVHAVRDMILSMSCHFDVPSPNLRGRMGAHLIDLVHTIVADSVSTHRVRTSDTIIFRAKQDIERRFADPSLDADSVARSVHVSTKHLQRLFASRGTTVTRYIWQFRLEQADRLLRKSVLAHQPVQEIAWRCGFSSASHFNRAFRERFGMTPGDVRRSQADCDAMRTSTFAGDA